MYTPIYETSMVNLTCSMSATNLIYSRCKAVRTNEHALAPCVAVTGYDDLLAFDKNQWVDFRAEYPDRPFCLLIPYHTDLETVFFPTEALTDPNFQVFTVPRDMVSDWFGLCGLDKMNSSDVQSIGLFLDDNKYFLPDSYKKFLANAAKANMKVCEAYGGVRWLDYFMNEGFIKNSILSPNMLSCKGPAPVSYDCLPTDACTCNDNDKCTSDVLDPASGLCSYKPKSCPESQSCDPVDG
jgi:hypothetical protein